MSGAAAAVQAALVAAISDNSLLMSMAGGIYDGAPPREPYPYIVIDDEGTSDWSFKGGRGREHRIGVTIWDEGLNPARLHMMMAEAEAAIEAMPVDLGGHHLASLVHLRSRIVRDAEGPWAGFVQYRARTMEV